MAVADSYASALAALLPPGRLWRLLGAALLPKLLLGSADELARLDARAEVLRLESIPTNATELLSEYEAELELVATGTNAERRARIVARYIARQRYRPADFQLALAPLLGQLAAAVVVIERTPAQAVAMGDAREIFRFFIYRNPASPGTYDLAGAQALITKIKPSHTLGYAIESINFLCDDPYSLTDRDLLGV